MRTAYVVLLLTILSAASSYGWELGVQAGVRDWRNTARSDERATPMMMLTFGEHISPNIPLSFGVTVGAWTHEARERTYGLQDYVGNPNNREWTSERPGYVLGGQAQIDNQSSSGSGKRSVRPVVGLGYYWMAEKDELFHQSYWHDEWMGELQLGIAIPMQRSADFLLQYGVANNLSTSGQAKQNLTFGYRFSVMK